jgi:hypothetical protein
MPRFEVHAPPGSELAQRARPGGQATVDIGEGEVANAELVGVRRDGDTVILTYKAPREAVAVFIGDERVELGTSTRI